ncbi:MAG TPA: hypothetical protein DDZ88_03065 [Verrucomicrobiales bacterium]|nr:hypothetical protein [Verrucomicrobiales bacterium]
MHPRMAAYSPPGWQSEAAGQERVLGAVPNRSSLCLSCQQQIPLESMTSEVAKSPVVLAELQARAAIAERRLLAGRMGEET